MGGLERKKDTAGLPANLNTMTEPGGRPVGLETDGLETGELAWILGRRGVNGKADMTVVQAAYSTSQGFGPDRMQRLAYTGWMEAYFRKKFGATFINLTTLPVVSAPYEPFLHGVSVLGSVDLPHVINDLYGNAVGGHFARPLKYSTANTVAGAVALGTRVAAIEVKAGRSTAAAEGFASGLFVMEEGPFLRGKIVNNDLIDIVDTSSVEPGVVYKRHDVARNLGDLLAFDGLYAHMRNKGFFDWTPDGITLSKLESPSGDPMGSAELDARQAQLFNIAIQGPAISKNWTGDHKLQCMPMDKVFVVIVADVVSELSTDPDKGIGNKTDSSDARVQYAAWKRTKDAVRKTAYETTVATTPTFQLGGGDTALAAAAAGVRKYKTAVGNMFNGPNAVVREDAVREINTFYKHNNLDTVASKWEEKAFKLKSGEIGIVESMMTNFRLMRVTSSYLTQYSGRRTDSQGRCGLRFGFADQDGTENTSKRVDDNSTVCAEYIVGGWCVGTVIDSAASRSTVGHQVRIAPASMAINVNVDIEWWSSDQLYRNYMDVGNTVQRRGMVVNPSEKEAQTARITGADVKLSAMTEFETDGRTAT